MNLSEYMYLMENSNRWLTPLAAGLAGGGCKFGLESILGVLMRAVWRKQCWGEAEKSSLCGGAVKERRDDDIIWKQRFTFFHLLGFADFRMQFNSQRECNFHLGNLLKNPGTV